MPSSPSKSAARRLAVAAAIGAGALAVVPAGASAAGTNACDASALQLSLLGGEAFNPIHANPSYTPCVTADGSLVNIPSLLSLVSAQAVTATTNRSNAERAVSESQIVGARIGSVGTVVDSLTGPLLSGPNSIVGQVDAASAGLLAPLQAALGPLGGLLGLNLTTDGLLGSVTGNLPTALNAVLPDVLSAGVINARAQATCSNGQGQLSGTSRIADLRVLGIAVDPNGAANQLLSIDTASLNLGQLLSPEQLLRGITVQIDNSLVGVALQIAYGQTTLSLWDLLNPTGGLVGGIDVVLGGLGLSISGLSNTLLGTNGAVQQLLNAVQVNLPPGLLRAQVTPNAQSIVGDQLTQQALTLSVSALGQPVLAGTLAQARVGAGAPGCLPPTTGPGVRAPERFSSPEAEAFLQCSRRPVDLIDVYGVSGRTFVQGVAERKYVGKTVSIFLREGNKRVGTVKVGEDGLFSRRVALPPASIRTTNKARYYATVDGKRTRALKFARRMETRGLTATAQNVTFRGRVVGPLQRRQQAVTIKQRVGCSSYKTVATVRPDSKGNFTARIKPPAGEGAVIYRAQTRVGKRVNASRLSPTFTLPRVVGLR